MELNIKNFLQLRNLQQTSYLENDIINEILSSFENNDVKKVKKNSYKKNNFNKNNKIKINKDKVSNKVKLILNKLSHNNINNLVLEFIQNIRINSQEDFDDFISTIYLKILSEISFVNVYLEFLKNIICTYNKVFNFNYSYFYDLIEKKFMSDYFNISFTDDNTVIIDSMSDDFRINNLKLIKEMVNNSYFDNKILKDIDSKILNQTMYLSDIYFWFKDTCINKENINLIKNILDTHHDIEIRDKILLQNLVSPYDDEPKKNKIIFKKKKNNSFDDNVNELINNYLINNDSTLIKSFIESSCKEINERNKLCEIIITNYFLNKFTCILDLIDELIVNQVLFKSNISKGLISIHNQNSEIINQNIKMKSELILKLKNLGITKNLEFLMDTYYNIEVSI
jgi:hypothetical protein